MTTKIGENICKLRKQHKLTQQQLSEIIGVSIAAISKWETCSAYPDIELLPKLASIFDVSIDYFFNYQLNAADNRKAIIQNANMLSESRQYSEAISMLTEAMHRYPNDMSIKFSRAVNLIYYALSHQSDSEKTKKLSEANSQLKEVIDNSESRQMVDESYYLLGMSYINLKDFDKALEAINQIHQSNHIDSGLALMRLFLEKGDIDSAIKQFEINIFFSIVHVHANTLWIDKLFAYDSEKAILFYEMAISAFKAYSCNKSCRFDVHISEFYERVALVYTKVKNFDKAITSLKLAVEYAHSFDNLQVENDLPQFDRLDASHTGWDKIINQKLRLWNKINSNIHEGYKMLNSNSDFIEIISVLKNTLP